MCMVCCHGDFDSGGYLKARSIEGMRELELQEEEEEEEEEEK